MFLYIILLLVFSLIGYKIKHGGCVPASFLRTARSRISILYTVYSHVNLLCTAWFWPCVLCTIKQQNKCFSRFNLYLKEINNRACGMHTHTHLCKRKDFVFA